MDGILAEGGKSFQDYVPLLNPNIIIAKNCVPPFAKLSSEK